MANDQTITEACRQPQTSDQAYYTLRREYGGLLVDQAKRMKELEQSAEQRCEAHPDPGARSLLSRRSSERMSDQHSHQFHRHDQNRDFSRPAVNGFYDLLRSVSFHIQGEVFNEDRVCPGRGAAGSAGEAQPLISTHGQRNRFPKTNF